MLGSRVAIKGGAALPKYRVSMEFKDGQVYEPIVDAPTPLDADKAMRKVWGYRGIKSLSVSKA